MLITRIWRQQPGKYFCISTKSARGLWKDNYFARSEFSKVPQFLKDNSDKDLYFCCHGLSVRSRDKTAAILPKLLWSDMDAADPRTVAIKPTIAIESSPGRFVGLWVVDNVVTESANRRLSYLIGADKSGWDLSQVLRVPGTINYKYQSLPRTRIMWSDGPEYKLRDIEKRLPAEASATESSDSSGVYKKWERKIPHWCRRELLSGRATVGKRSEVLWKLGNCLIESGVPRKDAFAILKGSVWNKFAGRRNEDKQLERELDKAVNKHMNGSPHHAAPDSDSSDYVWLAHSLDDVEEENIDWIWYPYLARGELTILEGDPGLGKSYLAQMVSGSICDGKKLPSVKHAGIVTGRVVYFDIENSAGSVTLKRIVGNGFVKLSNYIQEEAVFSIDDEDALEHVYEALEKVKPTLVVFDTINTYLGKADAFKGHEAQQAFVKFRNIAKRFSCAVLVLRHLTKAGKERALYRGQGSIAFAGLARVIMTVGVMPEDEDTRVMAVTKLNITKKPKALTFSIDALPDTLREKDRSRFSWGDFVDVTSEDIIAAPTESGRGDKDDGKEFLKSALSNGRQNVSKLENMAAARSVSRRTMYRAATELGVVKERGWWSIPS